VVIANSIGAVVTAAWVHDYAPRIRAMVLATPAFSIKLYVPFALPLLRLQMKLQKNPFVKSYPIFVITLQNIVFFNWL